MYGVVMTTSRDALTVDANALYRILDEDVLVMKRVRARDLDFLKGFAVDDPFDEVWVKAARFVEAKVHREDIPVDGVISLRVELRLTLAKKGMTYPDEESGVLWFNTDGDEAFIEFVTEKDPTCHEIEFKAVQGLAERLGLV